MPEQFDFYGLQVRRNPESPTGWEVQTSYSAWVSDGRWAAAIARALDDKYGPTVPPKTVTVDGDVYTRVGGQWKWPPRHRSGSPVDDRWVHGLLDRIWELENPQPETLEHSNISEDLAHEDEAAEWAKIAPEPRTVRLHTGETWKRLRGRWDTYGRIVFDDCETPSDHPDNARLRDLLRTLDLHQNGPRPGLGDGDAGSEG